MLASGHGVVALTTVTQDMGRRAMELAVVRAITTIDEDGDAAWRVLAVSTETHTRRAALADWPELAAPPAATGEGVGVASPVLFVAAGPFAWARRQIEALRREADDLLRRLRTGESDLADELAWLARPLRRRGTRFAPETWRALALRHLLEGDEPSELGVVEGQAGDRWLAAGYVIPPDADPTELEGLAGRALEVWLHLTDEVMSDE
jgi:hypothetical protein